MGDSNTGTGTEHSDSTTIDRRTMLKGLGTTTMAAAGVTAAASPASAQWGGPDIDVIDTTSWFTDDLPVVDELFVFVHGWFGDSTVESQAEDVAGSMVDAGYEADEYVAIEWDATTLNYFGAESETEDVGEELAEMIEEFYDDGGGTIRLVGHSLGGRVVLWTPNKLSSGYEIETVAPLGAAADGDTVCGGGWSAGQWYDGIANNAGEVRNYHSEDDSTVGSAYGGLGGAALGTDGSGCPDDTADNYTDVDVTDSVDDHFGFLGDEEVGSDLAAAIDGDDVDDDDDDGYWWT